MTTNNSTNTPRLTTDGQIVIGNTGTRPSAAVITSVDNSVTITNGAGSIDLSVGAAGSTNVAIQTFAANGTYTPTAGMTYCIIEAIGGGGGGGATTASGGGTEVAAAGGGAAGGYTRGVFSAATIGASKAVTIGAGGTGGAAGNNAGNAGGTTTVGALLTANGGNGGSASVATTSVMVAGGAGGTASGGNVNVQGQRGLWGVGITITGTGFQCSGAGGSSMYGAGGAQNNIGAGGNATGYGSGGGGAATQTSGPAAAGGNGTDGFVVVTEYFA